MPLPFEVTYEDVERLKDVQLTDVLRQLLYLETGSAGIPSFSVGVPMKIYVSDDGEDGRVQWQGGPVRTDWLPNRFTLFQAKATGMSPDQCKKEIHLRGTTQLKLQVEEVLDAGGTYILFYGRSCNTRQENARLKRLREAISEAGKPYADTANIQIYDANKIATWVNLYLPVAVAVCQYVGRSLPAGLQTWGGWEKYRPNRFTFVSDETIDKHIQNLRDHFSESGRIARIVGLSGLGKTRLALEAFRPPKNPATDVAQQTLSSKVVYIDAAFSPANLPSLIADWRNQKVHGILVVDNCPLELHDLMCREVEHSDNQLGLLTLDFNPERPQGSHPYVELKPTSGQVIKEILKQAYPGLPDPDIDRIAEFAQGFPLMAVLLADARLNNEDNIGSLNNDVLVDKLLWGRGQKDPEAQRVITACALFEQLGFEGERAEQRSFVAERICEVSPERFYEHSRTFVERGVLDVRGRFVRVIPRPLAVRLAADWWRRCSPERARSLFIEELPPGMVEALCDQLAKLHFLEEAQKLVHDLCGDQGPFGRAEVLNSERGSRLFRSLVEVDRHVTTSTLARIFGDWSREQLLEVGPGRRNLVWALEKLCFWEDTFPTAAHVLLMFAAAENESWGNNATNQFLQLFHVYLSGTQAPPEARLTLVDQALQSNITEERVLAIRALGHALQTEHFHRTGGPERQGSRPPLEDWKPKLYSDMFNYWRASLSRLTPIARGDDEMAELARQQIAGAIRGFVRRGLLDEIEDSIIEIQGEQGKWWPEALEQLENAIQYEGPNIPEEGVKRLEKLAKVLQPSSIPDQLRLVVSTPTHNYVEDNESGQIIDTAEIKVRALAEQLARRPRALIQHLPVILQGEQLRAGDFGFKVGALVGNPDEIVEAVFSALPHIPKEQINPAFLGGLLAAIQNQHPALVEKTLDRVAADGTILAHTAFLTHFINPTSADLDRVLGLVRDGKISALALRVFAYGRFTFDAAQEMVLSLCDSMLEFGTEGAWAALDILFMYAWRDEARKWEICKSQLRKTLLVPGFLSDPRVSFMTDTFRWHVAAKKLLNEGGEKSLAENIARDVVSICSNQEFPGFYQLDHALRPVLEILLSKYGEVVWPTLGEPLLSGDWFTNFQLEHLLDKGQILQLPPEFLLDWCAQHADKAPAVIAKLVPFQHPFNRTLIDRFGNRDDVLDAVASNMMSFSYVGTAIPHYQSMAEYFKQLLNHQYAEVRTWANKGIEYVRRQIREEKINDEESGLLT
jgi:hypothetical protein